MSGFEQSLEPGGRHHFLAQLVGRWTGKARLWFEADQLADESPVAGSIRSVLGGRFLVHEYENTIENRRVEGLALIGHDCEADRYEVAWVDSFHNGTRIMLSVEPEGSSRSEFSVLGSYGDGQGGPDWGWRTSIHLPEPDHMILRHFNISPQGDEALAVEFDYQREVEEPEG
jgi:hypothetical protein